jgi:2-polyprenyl-3-methyl-5-hydroxy-6-metoxy-1,4-benzoquinol methylase
MSHLHRCPNCGDAEISIFYGVDRVPVHSVLLMPTRALALRYPQGEIHLGLCHSCGFIGNVAFDATVHEYSPQYEATQSFSPTFNAFHARLARRLIDRYGLRNKTILEIGCGQGEFLILLCRLGNNRGIGFDPAYDRQRPRQFDPTRITFIPDFYSEQYSHLDGDFVCCKMTLEHIPNTAEFVSTVRRSLADRYDTVVFFQVPNVTYILREVAFWDIYYEHCSYFSRGSLAYLFARCGFEVLAVATDYGDQYLMIEARPARVSTAHRSNSSRPAIADTKAEVRSFTQAYPGVLQQWRARLNTIKAERRRAVLWGSGSKGVAFLTTLNVPSVIDYVVDVNPYRQGTFMAGSGQEIIAPEFLPEYRPDTVIVMNPIYRDEIQQELQRMGVTAQLIVV